MNPALLVKECGIDNYQWLLVDIDTQSLQAKDVQTGDSEALAQSYLPGAEVIFIAPTQDVTLRKISFEAHEKKMLRQTIPYSLEDDLLDDVNDLHFSLGEVQQQQVAAAWVQKDQLDRWLSTLHIYIPDVQQILPELLLLPCQEHSWTLIIDDDRWLLKSSTYEGFSLEAANATLALQLLLDESDELPESLLVYANDYDRDEILNQLPDLLSGIVQWQQQDYWQLVESSIREGISPEVKKLNLLQGDYERKLPWKKWWRTWKVAAILLIAVTILQFSVDFGHLKSLESTNLSLRAEIEKVYRTVSPRGAIVNAEKQLLRKVNALEGGGGGGFIPLLDKVAQVVATSEGLSIHSLNYTEKQSEIRLTILAPDFDDVETARANMEKLGLTARLTGSSSENGKTRARLRIKS